MQMCRSSPILWPVIAMQRRQQSLVLPASSGCFDLSQHLTCFVVASGQVVVSWAAVRCFFRAISKALVVATKVATRVEIMSIRSKRRFNYVRTSKNTSGRKNHPKSVRWQMTSDFGSAVVSNQQQRSSHHRPDLTHHPQPFSKLIDAAQNYYPFWMGLFVQS